MQLCSRTYVTHRPTQQEVARAVTQQPQNHSSTGASTSDTTCSFASGAKIGGCVFSDCQFLRSLQRIIKLAKCCVELSLQCMTEQRSAAVVAPGAAARARQPRSQQLSLFFGHPT